MPKKKLLDDKTVLEKALLVISDKGPETFTLQDIAKAVGLAPATLLQRFGSKQTLLIKAARCAQTKLSEDLAALKAQKLPWKEELILLLSGLPEGFGTREDIAKSLGLLKLDMVDRDLHPIARKLFATLRKRLKELLQAANLPSIVDHEKISWELDALRHGLIIQWTLSGSGTLQNWLQNGVQNYLEALLVVK